MAEDNQESTRNLLDDLEGGWESPRPGKAVAAVEAGEKDEARLHAELDAAVDRLFDTLDPPPLSAPDLSSLDSGWGEEDEDDEDEDEEEPELPDETLDPVAYAAAKKAREERVAARRLKRRAKLEAKKAKRRARALAAQQKQKSKKGRPAGPVTRERERARARVDARDASARRDAERDDGSAAIAADPPSSEAVPSRRPPSAKRALKSAERPMPWRFIVLVVAIIVGAAALAAMLAR